MNQVSNSLAEMLENSKRMSVKDNKELAKTLLYILDELEAGSFRYLAILEAAYRLSPETFE